MTDHELLVELRAIKQRVAVLICEVSERLEAEERILRSVMAELRRDRDHGVRSAPNDDGVAVPASTHKTIIPPGAFCCDVGSDDPDVS